MENCKATGFGLQIKNAAGKYVFHPFDPRGNQLILKEIVPKLTRPNDPAPLLKLTAMSVDPKGMIVSATRVSIAPDQKKRPASTPASSMQGHNM